MTHAVEIVEVGPRDGLQNEPVHLTTDQKLELIERLRAAGIARMEVASFAHPARVPQMADAEAVLAGLRPSNGFSAIGLVLNERGMARAEATAVDEVNFVVLATDTFSVRNQGMPRREALAVWRRVASRAKAHDIRVSATIAAAFGCPFEGEVQPEQVIDIAEELLEAEPDEITLADTIGVGVPEQVERLVAATVATGTPVRCHFHNTRNTGYANAFAAARAGARALDASLGGYGGCPFSPSATGNIATEDLAWALARSGFEIELDLEGLTGTTTWLADQLQRPAPALLGRAAAFPPGAPGATTT